MKDHRQWTAVFTYCRNIPIDQALVDRVKALVKEDKNVLIMMKKEDPKTNPKHEPGEKFKALGKALQKEFEMGRIIVSIVPDINKIIKLGD